MAFSPLKVKREFMTEALVSKIKPEKETLQKKK